MVKYGYDFRTKALANSTADALKARGHKNVHVRKVKGVYKFTLKGKPVHRTSAYRITYDKRR